MKISVIIPAYNCETTIRATLDSVLRQSLPANEILVMNDGSTDNTISILESYKDRINLFSQANAGVASVRNKLVALVSGDLVAFLDCDDLWHPKYLESRSKAFENSPEAVAFFSGHVNFVGRDASYQWCDDFAETTSSAELIEAPDFFRRYNETTGLFASMSYCCVPRSVLAKIGTNPFQTTGGTDDSYLMYELALLGRVSYDPMPLVAYRIIPDSFSSNRLRAFGSWVNAFELIESRYRHNTDVRLRREFGLAFASRRRAYAKVLMGVAKVAEARQQLRKALGCSGDPVCITKSLGLLGATCLPKVLQPVWPPSHRLWTGSENTAPTWHH